MGAGSHEAYGGGHACTLTFRIDSAVSRVRSLVDAVAAVNPNRNRIVDMPGKPAKRIAPRGADIRLVTAYRCCAFKKCKDAKATLPVTNYFLEPMFDVFEGDFTKSKRDHYVWVRLAYPVADACAEACMRCYACLP